MTDLRIWVLHVLVDGFCSCCCESWKGFFFFFKTILLFPTIKSVKLSESPKTACVVLQKHWKHENLLVQFCLQFCLPTRSAMCFPAGYWTDAKGELDHQEYLPTSRLLVFLLHFRHAPLHICVFCQLQRGEAYYSPLRTQKPESWLLPFFFTKKITPAPHQNDYSELTKDGRKEEKIC